MAKLFQHAMAERRNGGRDSFNVILKELFKFSVKFLKYILSVH